MLRITVSASVQAAKRYFEASLCKGDYYFEGQEVAGRWGGKGAERLRLAGQVDPATYHQLLDNLKPGGGRLTPRNRGDRRPAYDFTFDCPKSVSVVHALTGDERIVEAMQKAVQATMRVLETEMHARVRKGGVFEDRPTGNMIWADFTHFTTRPAPLTAAMAEQLASSEGMPDLQRPHHELGLKGIPDMQLHAHVLCINATYDTVEQQWKAGEFSRIKRDAPYYQAAFHTRLAGELQQLGYTIRPTEQAFELEGTFRETLSKFSRRKAQVEQAATLLGITDAKRKGAHVCKRCHLAAPLGLRFGSCVGRL